jgi:hypothetical protein
MIATQNLTFAYAADKQFTFPDFSCADHFLAPNGTFTKTYGWENPNQ